MILTVNGEPRTLADGSTVGMLVMELGFGNRRVAVEVNCDVITRDRYDQTPLRAGDIVEIVHFVGGG